MVPPYSCPRSQPTPISPAHCTSMPPPRSQPGQGSADPKHCLCTFPAGKAASAGQASHKNLCTSELPGWLGRGGHRGRRSSCGWRDRAQPIFSCMVSARLCPGSCQAQGGPPRCHDPQGQWLLFPCKSGGNIISLRALPLDNVWVETARDDSYKSCFFRKTREKSRGVV